MKIDYPSDQEIRTNINQILTKIPPKKTFAKFLADMHQQLGWHYIFRDYRELAILAILFVLYLVGFQQGVSYFPNHLLYSVLFMASPLLYGAISVFSLLDKQATHDIEMTCKYNVYQVSAYRMLIFSIVSILLNAFQIAAIAVALETFNPVPALMMSLSSLFVFAIGFLYVTKPSTPKWKRALAIGGWLFANIAVALGYDIPMAVFAFVLVVSAVMYVREIRKMGIGEPVSTSL